MPTTLVANKDVCKSCYDADFFSLILSGDFGLPGNNRAIIKHPDPQIIKLGRRQSSVVRLEPFGDYLLLLEYAPGGIYYGPIFR